MRALLSILVLAGLLSGCATQGLYDWGDYEADLFDYYHQPGDKERVIENLVQHLDRMAAQGRKPAPGLLAEAGTFYLLAGDAATAVDFYRQEAAAWPESRPMMATLITNLEAK